MDHAKRLAQEAGAEYVPPKAFYRKDKLVDRFLRERPITEGLICVLCCMECCPSFKLVYGKGRPSLVNTRRQQRVLYFYFLNPELGQIYIRLTTWFPFTVQVYVNGHSWLAQQMLKRRLGFKQQDNAFTALDHPHAAQKLADSFVDQNWPKILNRLVRQVNPLMRQWWLLATVITGSLTEPIATDVIFTSRKALAGLLPAAVGPQHDEVLGPGHPDLLGPTVPSSIRGGSAHSVSERSLAQSQDQTPHEEQLAEDVRQVRPGLADRDRD